MDYVPESRGHLVWSSKFYDIFVTGQLLLSTSRHSDELGPILQEQFLHDFRLWFAIAFNLAISNL
jgi:hypothetical protein